MIENKNFIFCLVLEIIARNIFNFTPHIYPCSSFPHHFLSYQKIHEQNCFTNNCDVSMKIANTNKQFSPQAVRIRITLCFCAQVYAGRWRTFVICIASRIKKGMRPLRKETSASGIARDDRGDLDRNARYFMFRGRDRRSRTQAISYHASRN